MIDIKKNFAQGLALDIYFSMRMLSFVIDNASFNKNRLLFVKLFIWFTRLHKLGGIGPSKHQLMLI